VSDRVEQEHQPGASEGQDQVDDAMSDAAAETVKAPDAEEPLSGAADTGTAGQPAPSRGDEPEEGVDADDAMGEAAADTAKTPDADNV
jgi:hypothetical protein